MHELSHFHFRKRHKSPVWRQQLPGNMEAELLDDLELLITLIPPCHHKHRVRLQAEGNLFVVLNSWTEHTASAVAFLWGPCARTSALLPQFHLLAKHQAPSALSTSCLALSHQRRRRLVLHFTLGITVLFWLFFVFSLSFPFWKDACCQGPTTSKWALCLPAPGFCMQPAALWGLPDKLPFSFHRTGGKLSWEDDTVGNRSVLLSLERLQICSLPSPKALLVPILGRLKSWNVTKNWRKPKENTCLKWSKWSKTYSTTNNTWLIPAWMLFAINEIVRKQGLQAAPYVGYHSAQAGY